MIINNNMQAMNTNRQLGNVQSAQAKSMEKLSSGYRINRAGDDAAGLAISEKMRGQISGLDQASRNAEDGISLIQTAEGALNETQNILQRMRELSVQSATDTNTDADREEIQKEVDQLATEITRISTDTEFNTKSLLNGDLSTDANALTFQIGANKDQNVELTIADMGAQALGVIKDDFYQNTALTDFANIELTSSDGESMSINFTAALTANANPAVAATTAEVTQDTDGNDVITITLQQDVGTAGAPGALAYTEEDVYNALKDAGVGVAEGTTLATANLTAAGTTQAVTFDAETDKATIATLGEGKGINVSSQDDANNAIKTINDAITSVSSERSKLGATQNRLEYTISNLDTSAENLQAAESRIRDVDMATEMMEFTKNNILSSAATSMLSQANQAPQSVLQLLQ